MQTGAFDAQCGPGTNDVVLCFLIVVSNLTSGETI